MPQTHDGAAGRQVGAGDELHDVFGGRLVGDEMAGTLAMTFAQVMRRHVIAMPTAMPVVPLTSRFERCGQHGGLHELVVVVGTKSNSRLLRGPR